jgi:uncharacterized protein
MLIRKIKAVAKILEEAEKQTSLFGTRNNITCTAGCGKCCITPNIEASPLEFLPAAYELYKQGRINEFYDRITILEEGSLCVFYNPPINGGENCTFYPYRGLICRVFGFSTRVSKNNQLEMITCTIIKQSAPYHELNQQKLKIAPVASDFYMQLRNIDIREAENLMPINEALKKAMETVMFHFRYNSKKPAIL